MSVRCGMSAETVFNVIAYGWSDKSENEEMIGMYGNGLKSGSMRAARDILILTKKGDECSALLISRTFIENGEFENKNVRIQYNTGGGPYKHHTYKLYNV